MKHLAYSKTKLSNVQEQDIQPNAVDIRLDKVFRIDNESTFELSENTKVHRGSVKVEADEDGWFVLYPGQYEVVMENIISVAENEAGWVITRSTLNRNGVFLTSGLFDSGYAGQLALVLHCSGLVRIKRGTRIGQYLCFDADTAKLYDGSYGFDKSGNPKPEELKLYGKPT